MEDLHEHLHFDGLSVWVLSDGKPGHLNQSLGVAEALGTSPRIVELQKHPLGKFLAWVTPAWAVKKLPRAPWPDMVIATGNLTAQVARYIKEQSPRTFVVQMMRPTGALMFFDVLAVPAHDRKVRHHGVVKTLGAPNRISSHILAEGESQWRDTFSKLPQPRIAVLVGGSSARYKFTPKKAEALAAELKKLQEKLKASLLVTMSRRTGAAQEKILREALAGEHTYIWNGEGENPYFGLLAHADVVVTTVDSVSMASEACTAGKPLLVFDLSLAKKMGKFGRFFNNLQKHCGIAELGKGVPTTPRKLDDAAQVAGFVRGRYLRFHTAGE